MVSRRQFLLGIAGGLLPIIGERVLSAPNDKSINEIIRKYVRPRQAGVAVFVNRNSQLIHLRGYGMADISRSIAINENTTFNIASVSKQFTCLAIAILQEQGKLNYRDAITKYLKNHRVPSSKRPVTILDLIYHLSGLGDYTSDDWDESQTKYSFTRITIPQHLEWLNNIPRRNPVGEVYDYNNSGYVLLAHIIETITGKTYGQFLEDAIFRSLGMNNSFVQRGNFPVPNLATGYLNNKISSKPTFTAGDGNVCLSISDLARYDRALWQSKLVTPTTWQLIFRNGRFDDGSPLDDGEGKGDGYGFGWSLRNTDNSRIAYHSGSWWGWSAYYQRDITNKIGIGVLSNDEEMDTEAITDDINNSLI
jgi:CubicO group peptidase (beta-lactamase class C family)